MVNDSPLAVLLSSIGSSSLLNDIKRLTSVEKNLLLAQIKQLDLATLQKQQQLLKQTKPSLPSIEPFQNPDLSGNTENARRGKQLIAEGGAGCLILAGGQGTRLQFDGPKGMFPISVVKKKSLFQLIAEKTYEAGRQAGRMLPIALMTSEANHEQTLRFFADHALFGLKEKQLSYFSQTSLPMLTQEGSLFLETPGRIVQGPDGNGAALHHFYRSGLWERWKQQGVQLVNMVLIDNPLADPFDAELLGTHLLQQNQITIKCTLKKAANEPVGVLAKQQQKTCVVEYSELPEAARLAVDSSGAPLFKYANLSLFCFSMQFIEQIAKSEVSLLPLHQAFKQAQTVKWEGGKFQPEKCMGWKFERFIFDLLPYADKVGALLYPREECFAPLKNLHGEGSMETVQAALQARDKKIFSSITGNGLIAPPFELSQEFYYPTPAFLKKWRGSRLPATGYIE